MQPHNKSRFNLIPWLANFMPRLNCKTNCFLLGISIFMTQSCASPKAVVNPQTVAVEKPQEQVDNFPLQSNYPDYKLVDLRNTDATTVTIKKNQKVAFVVRNLAVTAFSNLDTPRYNKKFAQFEGVEQCCQPTQRLMGASGLLMYRFVFIKTGQTKVELIARHKGLDPNAAHLDGDDVKNITVQIDSN